MTRTPLSLPEIALIGGTRAALGAGLALLLADRLNDDHRRAVGWTLFAMGAVTTLPIALGIARARTRSEARACAEDMGRLAHGGYAS